MITEQYVSFDTAKMLKEAGFRVPSRGLYLYNPKDKRYKLTLCILGDYDETNDDMYESHDYYGYGDFYLAPTQALAARWLREAHRIHTIADACASGWYYELCKATNGTRIKNSGYEGPNDGGCWDNYESALEAGLQEVLQLIIKNKEL